MILTNEGDFQSVRLRRSAHLSIGQTVRIEHLSHLASFMRRLAAPLIAFSFSLLCFAPLTQSTIESEKPVAYVNFSFASHVEAAVDRNFNVVSVSEKSGKPGVMLNRSPGSGTMSFEEFTEVLINRISSRGELRKGTSLLFSAVVTEQLNSRDREQFSDQLVHTFISQTMKLVPDSRFQPVTASLAAVRSQFDLNGAKASLKQLKVLSVSEIGDVIPSFTASFQKLVEKIKGTGEGQGRIPLKGALSPVHTLFRNPFSIMEQSSSGNPSSYLFPHRKMPARLPHAFILLQA